MASRPFLFVFSDIEHEYMIQGKGVVRIIVSSYTFSVLTGFMRNKKRGHWIRQTHVFKRDEYKCSLCGYLQNKQTDICPKCSARMKGSKYDPLWVDEMEAADIFFN